MKQIPNVLTVLRFILTIFFIQFLTQPGMPAALMAAAIFICAALTDYYDGYLARKYQWITNFGKIMDPIADKFLVLAAFYVFAAANVIPFWMFFLIFLREILVTGTRLVAVTQGKVLAAEQAGKYKTVLQIATIGFVLVYVIIRQSEAALDWPLAVFNIYATVIIVLMWVTLGLTLFSGFSFFWHNWKINDV